MGSDDFVNGDHNEEKRADGATDELRYEGPITFDDDFEEEFEEPSGRSPFLTTVVIGAAVILVVAIALVLRSESGGGDTLAELGSEPGAATIASAEGQQPESAAPGTLLETAEAPPAETRAAAERESEDYRAIPDTPPAALPEPPVEKRAAAQPTRSEPLITRPKPREARQTTPAPAQKRAATTTPQAIANLARSGQVSEAAREGERLAASEAGNSWTLQVLLACQPSTVQRAFEKVSSDALTVLPTTYQGRSCYRLCWGVYGNRDSAERAIGGVDNYFLDAGKPRPVPLSTARGR